MAVDKTSMRAAVLSGVLLCWLVLWTGLGRAQSNCPPSFVGFLPPRLAVGEQAQITPGGTPNRLRSAPSINAAQVGVANPSVLVQVTEGPMCGDGIVWWRVTLADGINGWTAEGLLPNQYFVQPVSPEGIARGQNNIAAATALTQQTAQSQAINSQATINAAAAQATTADNATLTARAALPTAPVLAVNTLAPIVTATAAPTLPPSPLPTERQVLTLQNISALQPLSRVAAWPWRIVFSADGSQVALEGWAFDLPSMTQQADFQGIPMDGANDILHRSDDGRWIVYVRREPYALARDHTIYLVDTQGERPQPVQLPSEMTAASDIAISNGPAPYIVYTLGESYGAEGFVPLVRGLNMAADGVTDIDTENVAQFGMWLALNNTTNEVVIGGDEMARFALQPNAALTSVAGLIPPEMPTIGISGDLAFNLAGDTLAYGALRVVVVVQDGRGRVFQLTSGNTAGRVGFNTQGTWLGATGRELEGVFLTEAPAFDLFDVASGRSAFNLPNVRAFAFSPDGTLLVTATSTETIFWGVPTP
jgi:hypothetical protein